MMEYSPFNAVVWLVFAGFVAVTYLTVRAFHGKYPKYPNAKKERGKSD